MAIQNSLKDLATAESLLVVDGETNSETRRVHSRTYGSVNALSMELVDASGNQVVSFGGGTQYTEDAAAAANPVGTAPMLIRTDTPATQVSLDGDNIAQRGTNYGAAYVQLVTSAGAYIDSVGGGTQYAVDAALGATPTGTLAVAIRDDALSALTPVEGDAVGLRVDANGALWVGVSGSVAVTGTFYQATQPVSLASVPSHAVTNAGTFAVQAAEADGANVTLGAKADAKSTATDTTAITIMQVLKQISASVQAPPSQAVTGTFYQATQPVSIASMPSTPVTGTFYQATQPVSEADGANVTLGAKADAKSTATDTTAITIMQVLKQISASVQAPPSQAVTFTGSTDVATQTTLASALTSLQLIDNAISGAGFNITQINGEAIDVGAGTEAAAIRVTLPTDGTGVVKLGTGVAEIGNVKNAGTFATQATLQTGSAAIGKLAANSGVDIGDVDITSIIPGTGATSLGKAEDAAHASSDTGVMILAVRDDTIGVLSGAENDYEPLHTNENGALWVEQDVSTKGGWSVGNFTSGDTYTALTATAQVIKASAGKFGGYYIYNPNTAATYVHIYNIAAASVTVGTSTAIMTFCIPASSAANLEMNKGIAFGTAMSCAATTTGGGNTAPTTALECLIWYK